jgi:NAD-dependent dihydropyrimidine dehydrogenase PreA subunit
MERIIIEIDENKCTGCGQCIPNCPEGALQIIDGKARLVSDLMCDGLGACLGHCPEGAITTIKREAEAYDERKVMANIVKQGANTISAHLHHLKSHGQTDFYNQAVQYLDENNIIIPKQKENIMPATPSGCPGARTMAFAKQDSGPDIGKRPSQLTHWPLQLHLISPQAPHYRGGDMLLAADCVAFPLAIFTKII